MPGRYVAFVRLDVVKDAHVETRFISTINQLRSSGLPTEAYSLFIVPTYGTVDDLLENKAYRRLDQNPEYEKLYLTAGN